MRRFLYVCISILLIMTMFVSCKKTKIQDITAFTKYISQDTESVIRQVEKSGYLLEKINKDTWIAQDLKYKGIPTSVIFSFSDCLMAYAVEYVGDNTKKGKDAAKTMYDTLVDRYGNPSYPEEMNDDEWNALWEGRITSASGTDQYGGFRMVEYRWENAHCEFWVRLYGENGSDGLRIWCRHYQQDAWNAMYKK